MSVTQTKPEVFQGPFCKKRHCQTGARTPLFSFQGLTIYKAALPWIFRHLHKHYISYMLHMCHDAEHEELQSPKAEDERSGMSYYRSRGPCRKVFV